MDEPTEPRIIPEEVRRLRLEPGDRLIVRVRDTWPAHQVREYGEWLRAKFPNNEAVIIVGEEIAVESAVERPALSDEDVERIAEQLGKQLVRDLRMASMRQGLSL